MKATRFPGTQRRRRGTNWGVTNSQGHWGHDEMGNILAWGKRAEVNEWIGGAVRHAEQPIERAVFSEVKTDDCGRLVDERAI